MIYLNLCSLSTTRPQILRRMIRPFVRRVRGSAGRTRAPPTHHPDERTDGPPWKDLKDLPSVRNTGPAVCPSTAMPCFSTSAMPSGPTDHLNNQGSPSIHIPSVCLSVCLSVHIHHLAGGPVRPSCAIGPRGIESPSHPVIIAATSTAT